MADTTKLEQVGMSAFYDAIPKLDTANEWFECYQAVNDFIELSPVAEDGSTPPMEEEETQKWHRRQKFYSAMLRAKLTNAAAQRINARNIHQVQQLLEAVKENFKPDGSATYVHLHRRYLALTRQNCGSAQSLAVEIRKGHAEKLLLDPSCVTSEIEKIFFFLQALGPEYESFRDFIFRQMSLVNERDADGNIVKAAPTFEYIENKAVNEEHRKARLNKGATEGKALPVFALARGSAHRTILPSPSNETCVIEIRHVPYCTYCRKPYHVQSGCFQKNPHLRRESKDRKDSHTRPGDTRRNRHRPTKRQSISDEEEDSAAGPKDPKKPTFMATQSTREDVNAAFAHDLQTNLAVFHDALSMMATRILPIREAWIIDSGCAQHVCNTASKFVQVRNYHGPPLRSVDTSTYHSGIGTVNILCNVRGKRKWLILDNVLFVPSAHANLISVLQLLKRGAKIEFSS